jgi:hypothetical protein
MRLFFYVSPLQLKLGRLYALAYGKETPRRMPLLSLAKHDSTIITSEASNHTSTETKAEQLDGIVIRHAAHTALAMTTNDYCTIEANRCNNTHTHDQNQWIIFFFFYIVAMLIKPKEIVKRRT